MSNEHHKRCPVCGSKLFDTGKFCYNCDSEIGKETEKHEKAQCFIATAAYGTPFADDINILRRFRDDVLERNCFGSIFVKNYYKISPPIAKLVEKSRFLRWLVRSLLRPIIGLIEYTTKR